MKKIKWANIIVAICYSIAGIMFFADANLTKDIICTWAGYGLLIVGAIMAVSYLVRPKSESFFRDDFGNGLIYMTLGILVFTKKAIFFEFVYFGLAIIIMISGYRKLQDCVDAYRFGSKNGVLYLVLASVSILIGIFILVDTSLSLKTLHYLIGGGLLFSGISDLASSIFLSGKMFEYSRNVDKAMSDDYQEEKLPEKQEEILDDENKTPEL